MGLRSFLYLLFALLLHAKADAQELFSAPGVAVNNYNQIVRSLKAGDRITFSDGTSFLISGIINHGLTTLILDIGNNKVLRIPLFDDKQEFLDSFYDGARNLANHDVPVISADFSQYLQGEYLVVEKTPIRFTFKTFVNELARNPSDPSLQKALADLKEFAMTTAHVAKVGDLNDENLVHTGTRWIVLDMTDVFDKHMVGLFANKTGPSDQNIFTSTQYLEETFARLPPTEREEIARLIYEKRKNMLTVCGRFLKFLKIKK